MNNYADRLKSLGAIVRENGIWASVGHPEMEFGWKIHLSSVQWEADALLSVVVPLLLRLNIPFKVAKDANILGELNEGTFGHTQVGKFVTVYPPTPESSMEIAGLLTAITSQFVGPTIVTDLHIGTIVYARYGSYSPRFRRDRLGNVSIDDPENVAGYKIPFIAPKNQTNPFVGYGGNTSSITKKVKPIGPGYLLMRRLSDHAKGSIFCGIDLRSQDQAGIVILKEGRRFCMSDRHGRHIWDRLRHQFDLAQGIGNSMCIARARDLFEEGNILFLVLDYVEGTDFTARSTTPFEVKPAREQATMVAEFIGLTDTLGALHQRGIVHRDLSPRNVRVTPDGRIFLLDLEMSHRIDDSSPPYMQGTLGFISPQQIAGKCPSFADDIYSLGCLLVSALTGLDPRRLSIVSNPMLSDSLDTLSGAPRALVDLAVNSICTDPVRRPSLLEFRKRLVEVQEMLHQGDITCLINVARRPSDSVKHEYVLKQALNWLVGGGMRQYSNKLPLSPEIHSHQSEVTLSMPQAYRLYRSASRGVGGVIYTIARLSRLGVHTDGMREFVAGAVDWLLDHEPTPDDQMPGLHFGEAGVAMAIVEALRSDLIEFGQWLPTYLNEALSGPIDWPDLTHGAAGQGLAAMHCAAVMKMPELAHHADECAVYLIDSQLPDGSWSWPKGVDGMEGTIYSGFAHGVAGIVYFLSGYRRRTGSTTAHAAAERGAEWLLRQARKTANGKSLWWPMQVGDDQAWHWWCHGGPGISLAFLGLYEICNDTKYADLVRKALISASVTV